MALASGAWEQRELSDLRIERFAPQWPVRRQPGVDRGILRLAMYELNNTDTPPKVVLDEAIELAKAFSTEQSPAFINGVLDAVLKENIMLTQEPGDAGCLATSNQQLATSNFP
jgi:N utilization substance protein B